ncbi:MAG: tetratricopeptide repeat protein [Sneathiellaceae bacterium]
MSDSELFREVHEEVRKERYQQLARRLAPLIIGVVLAIALAVGGWFGWQAWQDAKAEDDARAYVAAVGQLREGKAAEAADALAILASEASGGYRALALLQRAAALEDEGYDAAAIESYRQLAADGEAHPDLRAVARLRAALLAIGNGEALPAIRDDLGPLTGTGNPYRDLAAEVEAAALLQSGDRDGAVAAYRALSGDTAARPGVRQRAGEVLQALGQAAPAAGGAGAGEAQSGD